MDRDDETGVRVTEPPGDPEGARLVVLLGGEVGRMFPVGDRATLGRKADLEVPLTGPGISRTHAVVERTKRNHFVIKDLDSKNGTQVNGEPLEGERVLHYGDKVFIGSETVLLFAQAEPLEDQLQQLQKMQSLGELASGVAHDFNNLMSVVAASMDFISQLSDDTTLSDEDVRDCLKDTAAAARRASELTRRLVQFARPNSAARTLVDLGGLLVECGELVRRTFDGSIDVQVRTEPGVMVHGDATQLMQVVMNLCVNARDAMPDGGKLTLTAVGRGPSEASSGAAYAELMVMDTGVGMDEATRQHIFEPFFTTRGDDGGIGLGLSQTLNVVRNHGGYLNVTSDPGQGARFRVLLPRTSASQADSPTVERGEALSLQPGASRARVLIVDDESLVRRSTQRYLRSRGYDVVSAATGAEGVEVFSADHAALDAVLLDLNLPGMSGEDVLRSMRRTNPSVPVVVYSGHWDTLRIEAALAEGARSFVRKPAHGEALERSIRAVMSGR